MTRYPMSFAQQRFWLLYLQDPSLSSYHISTLLEFEGPVDASLIRQSVALITERHEALRTTFEMEGDEPVQKISGQGGIRFDVLDGSLLRAGQNAESLLADYCNKPFDLGAGPLIRFAFVACGAGRSLLGISMHHIISDGWSQAVLVRELTAIYKALAQKQAPALPPLALQYLDYSEWQRQDLQGEKLDRLTAYWKEQLKGIPACLSLPLDFDRPPVQSQKGCTYITTLDKAALDGLKRFSLSGGISLYTQLLGAYALLLSYYSQENDIVIGSPVANRQRRETEDLVGLFVNTVAMRINVDWHQSPGNFLNAVKNTVLHAQQHQDLPFELLVQALSPPRSQSVPPVFQVLFALQNMPTEAIALDGISVKQHWLETGSSKFDLSLLAEETPQGLVLKWEYCSDLFRQDSIERLAQNYEALLGLLLQGGYTQLSELELPAAAQREQLRLFSAGPSIHSPNATLNSLLQQAFLTHAGKTALVCGDSVLSYGQLDQKANEFAAYLQQQHHIKTGDLVGIKLARNEWMIVAMLGILKAGAAYVPIDPAYPQQRIDYIRQNSNCRLIVARQELLAYLKSEENYTGMTPDTACSPGDLAYIIYTSGSTGEPKGVEIRQRNVAAFIHWCMEEFGSSDFDTVLGTTSVCFDLSVFEIFYTLCAGKKLRLLNNALSVQQHLDQGEKLLLNTVPSVVTALIRDQADLSAINVLNMAGEALSPALVQSLDCDAMEVRNLYGPSEDTTYSTCYRLQRNVPVLIGKPVSNTSIQILDPFLRPLPVGVPGEIFISGECLSTGYLNQPALSVEKFLPHPYEPGQRLYRSGDIGKWMADGNIAFVGRKDDQVKLRGYRIEPGEIENVLSKLDAIAACAVAVKADQQGEMHLAAYLVCRQAVSDEEISRHLLQFLPPYMVPGAFMRLEAMPLNSNGKTDKRRLPDMAINNSRQNFEMPHSATQKALAAIWAEVLGIEGPGLHDDFFKLGGYSLKALQVINRVYKDLGVRLELNDLFENNSLAKLAARIDSVAPSRFEPIPTVPI